MRDQRFVMRVPLGEYIIAPQGTMSFEMRTCSKTVPSANKLMIALHQLVQGVSSVRIRAQCKVWDLGTEYLHRWVFLCAQQANVKIMQQ